MTNRELGKRYSAPPEEIQTDYFQWLCGLVNLDRGYWLLAKKLHRKEFYWTVPNDDNRDADGRRLRDIFEDETLYCEEAYDCLAGPSTMLEMMVGLSIRMEDILCDPEEPCDLVSDSFWDMLENLGIDGYSDMVYTDEVEIKIDEILTTVLERTYSRSGQGGLFPLKSPRKDQRKVEIWYQMSTYLLENFGV